VLTADYSFIDYQRDSEGESLYRWLLIDGETETEIGSSISLQVPASALAKKLAFEVTPIATRGALQGRTVRSELIDIKTEKLLFTANKEIIIDIMSGLMEEQSHLFVTDGTEEGTIELANLDGVQITQPVVYGDKWLFTRKTADNKVQLMVSDGTRAGTMALLGDSNELVNLNPKNLAVTNGLVYFSGYDAVHGQELWSTDGTNANTQLVSDINPGASSSDPVGMIWLEDSVYVSAVGVKPDGTAAGRELFFIDGGNAVLVKDINPNGSSYPFYMTLFNDKLYFQAWDGETGSAGGNELWSSDGGFHGTVQVKDLYADSHSYPVNFTVVGDDLYFTTSTTNDPSYGELWKTRGLAENTVAVGRDYHQKAGKLTAFGDKLVYSAAVADQVEIPWSAIATSDTHTDLTSLDSAKLPGLPVVLGNEVYFKSVGSDGNDYELYSASAEDMSSPTLRAEISANGPSNPTDLVKLNGLILFTADDGVNGRELWRFDGSQASIVKEFISGANSSSVNLNLPTFFMMGER
jgi:ELWxxDGT repeat protein